MKKKVSFYNSKKEKLSGLLFTPSKKEKYPAIVFCHGFTSSKYSKRDMAENISKKGFSVLIFDASGSGESEGKFEDHTITKYVGELRSAVEFLKTLDFVDKKRIGIAGHSLGGMVVIAYAARFHDIKAVIPVDAPYHILKDRGEESHFGNKEFLQKWEKEKHAVFDVRINKERVSKKLHYKFVDDAKKYDLSSMIKKVKCPVVIVQGDADRTVPPTHATKLFNAVKTEKDLIFVRGVNHRYKGKDEKILQEILIENFSKYLTA